MERGYNGLSKKTRKKRLLRFLSVQTDYTTKYPRKDIRSGGYTTYTIRSRKI
jgi:hypothetical protein